MTELYKKADEYMQDLCKKNPDPSHDILHVRRVVSASQKIAKEEKADLEVVTLAAYLHDCEYVSKSSPLRSKASSLSADKAVSLLKSWGLEEATVLEKIHTAVKAHSYSANIKATSLEAKIVQDADRLDAIGAIGTCRALVFGGLSKRPIYNEEDPFCDARKPDDYKNTLDHFYVKLLKLYDKLNTESAKAEGLKRLNAMKVFLDELKRELLAD